MDEGDKFPVTPKSSILLGFQDLPDGLRQLAEDTINATGGPLSKAQVEQINSFYSEFRSHCLRLIKNNASGFCITHASTGEPKESFNEVAKRYVDAKANKEERPYRHISYFLSDYLDEYIYRSDADDKYPDIDLSRQLPSALFFRIEGQMGLDIGSISSHLAHRLSLELADLMDKKVLSNADLTIEKK